jgi:hypothetical protein
MHIVKVIELTSLIICSLSYVSWTISWLHSQIHLVLISSLSTVVDYGETNKTRNINLTCGEEWFHEASWKSSMYDIHMEMPTPTFLFPPLRSHFGAQG